MFNQKMLLRVILFSLGIAAVVGAFGILFARSAVIAQIDGTLVLTAICCALLLWISRKSAAEGDTRALLLSTVLIATEFGLGCVAIWCGDLFERTSVAALQTMAAVAVTGIPAVTFLKLDKAPSTRIAALAGLGFSTAVFLLWMWAIVWDWKGNSNVNFFGYGWVLGVCGVFIVAALIGVGTDRWHWRWIGVVSALTGLFIAGRYIHSGESWNMQPLLALGTLSLLIGHANLALRCRLKANQIWLAYGTIAAVAAACVFTNIAAKAEGGDIWEDRSVYSRIAGAAGVLAACGTIALAILYRINQRILPPGEKKVELDSIAIVCPVCQKKQTITGGAGACDQCGLDFQIKMTEPRCPACGYSLLMFKGDRCPECGAATSAEARGAKQNAQGASSLGIGSKMAFRDHAPNL
jgi:hypothetical protein